jgi:ankyrin repeat protein
VLVNAGGDIKKKRANGNTPLHDAAAHGNYIQMEVLIEKGVDINALNDSHQTPLDLLISQKNQLKRLTNKCSYNRNRSVESYMKSKYEKSLKLLREQGATTGSAIETEKN